MEKTIVYGYNSSKKVKAGSRYFPTKVMKYLHYPSLLFISTHYNSTVLYEIKAKILNNK